MLGSSANFRAPPKDIELAQPPSDSVSKIDFAPTQDILAVASWDNNVRLYNVNSQGQNEPRAMYSHEAPVLDLAWTPDSTRLFSAGCDNAVQMYDMNTGQKQQVAAHDAPVKCVRYVEPGQQVLVTAGWDKQMKYWDLRTPNPINVQQLSERAYAMDATNKIVVVGTADRQVHIYDLSNPFQKLRQVESPLKWQTRVISCFPDSVTGENGYAIGSIEGRVGFQFTHSSDEKKNFSFKCHRVDIPTGSMQGTPATTSSQNVFAINTITFHRQQGTFCTGGGDGAITIWDGVARSKLKTLSAKDLNNGDTDARPPVYGVPITSTSFNHTSEVLAYALSYDWSKGHQHVPPASANATRIMLHPVKPEEVNRKKK